MSTPAALGVLALENSDAASAGAFSMLLLLVALVLWSSHALHVRFITEGSLALLWGLAAGGGFYFYFERFKGIHIPSTLATFNYDIYMQLLLPPIIFYAGFSIKKKHFFENFGALVALGVGGTFLVAGVLAVVFGYALKAVGLADHTLVGNALALGTIFASTDSVAALQSLDGGAFPQLHALVFGEAVVNDATAIVLLRAVQKIQTEAELTAHALGAILGNFVRLSVFSMALGAAVGLACAFILKSSFSRRHSTDHEVALLATLGFLSYLLAEFLGLSGVFSAFFCGLTMSHYAWHSLSPSAKVSSAYAFRMLSFLAELAMFLSCGLDLWSTKLWHKDIVTKKTMLRQIMMLGAWISAAVPAARFLVALPLVAAINACRRPDTKISRTNALALGLAGCARGAVTLALAVNQFEGSDDDQGRIIGAAAMAAVVFSTVFLGGATPALFSHLLASSSGSTSADAGPPVQFGYNEGSSAEVKGYEVLDHFARVGSGEPNIARHDFVTNEAAAAAAAAAGLSSQATSQAGRQAGGFHLWWVHLDRRYLQPLFGGRQRHTQLLPGGQQQQQGPNWSENESFQRPMEQQLMQEGSSRSLVSPWRENATFQQRQQMQMPETLTAVATTTTPASTTPWRGNELFQEVGPAEGGPPAATPPSRHSLQRLSPGEAEEGSGLLQGEGGLSPFVGTRRGSSRPSTRVIAVQRTLLHPGGRLSGRHGETTLEVDDSFSEMLLNVPGQHAGESYVDRNIENDGMVQKVESLLEN